MLNDILFYRIELGSIRSWTGSCVDVRMRTKICVGLLNSVGSGDADHGTVCQCARDLLSIMGIDLAPTPSHNCRQTQGVHDTLRHNLLVPEGYAGCCVVSYRFA